MSKKSIDIILKKAQSEGVIDESIPDTFPEKMDDSNYKIRITTMIDGDLKIKLQDEAKKKGLKYQTLINTILRKHFSKSDSVEERLRLVEMKLEKIS